ncbi:MAG: NAD(P)/FAD-dependent oxidoreductase [Ruminococcaceae bacterium]|nr:NAD(P)/FAD-dependent oxidoreductase [Oscillospiraceae bacterium]
MADKRIAVIGGGAAGMTAAIFAAESGADVTIYERNDRLGKKLLITGKGRCNVTNNSDINTHIENTPRNPRFLYTAHNNFTPQDVMAFFESLGVPLKTERGDRVFPQSDKAADVCGALKRRVNGLGVRIVHERVKKIEPGYEIVTEKGSHAADAVIIATGGLSYPLTGSTGDGYEFAKSFGHTIVAPKPSLVPVECTEKWVRELMGLSLRNVTLTVCEESGREVFFEQGEMLFTHFGVSGPLVLSASGHMQGLPGKKYRMAIDLKPALDEQTLDKRLQSDFAKNINRDFTNSLGELLPSKLIPVIVRLSGIDARKKVNAITREERQNLVRLLKNLTLTATKFRPIDEAIITSGGVSVKEISPKTMESKLSPGLYFAGEVIDVDAYTGGFNLQIAFATAKLAGENAAYD